MGNVAGCGDPTPVSLSTTPSQNEKKTIIKERRCGEWLVDIHSTLSNYVQHIRQHQVRGSRDDLWVMQKHSGLVIRIFNSHCQDATVRFVSWP